MDLRNLQITVREILVNPAARAVVQRELPGILNSPLLSFAQNMTLQAVMGYAGAIPADKRECILQGLRDA